MNKYYGFQPGVIPKEEKEHSELVREIAAKGMVLLENDGTLPLKPGIKLALYGAGARNTVFCGLGAASFISREEITIEEGLKRAGFAVVSSNYLKRYAERLQEDEEKYYSIMREAAKDGLIHGVVKMYGEPFESRPQPILSREDLMEAGEAEIAVFVVSRVSGEGADRKCVPGDYLLSEEEKKNLRILSENFKKLVVLLNVGGVIDTSYFKTLPNLGALLLVGQSAGMTGLAAADVLTGKVVPEGKLVDTWAQQYSDYPSAENFGAMNGDLDDEWYTEGIYVGYRYFDSFGIKPAYPFGYGLSYTDFSIVINQVYVNQNFLTLEVSVTNTGNLNPGREVVQVYISAPEGELKKPYQELKGFAKTSLLAPGETQKVTVKIELSSLACYKEKTASWILEAGEYLVRVGNSSRNTQIAAVLRLQEEILCEKCRNLCRPEEEIKEIEAKSRHSFFERSMEEKEIANTKVLAVAKENIVYKKNQYRRLLWENRKNSHEKKKRQETQVRYEDVLNGTKSLDDLVFSLTPMELSWLCVGNAGDEEATFVTYGSGNTQTDAMIPMAPGTCDTTRNLITEKGIPNMHMSDGGSGLRLLTQFEVDKEGNLLTDGVISVRNVAKIIGSDFITDRLNNNVFEQYTTGLPMATLLAQTWDKDCFRKCGEIVGKEMQRFHVELWLAPSMNIHRNPLCGRNFEYYSEDPLITGECAASVIRAIQSFRCAGVTMKHFACNNQEDNRHGVNVHISERALREIYLKGYEIAVKKSSPTAMMSSYNLINGIHTANCYDLLTSIARNEWGFEGMIMTDWGTTSKEEDNKRKYKASTCQGCIRAGNDLIMPGSRADIKELYESVMKGKISMDELRLSAKRILKTMIRLEAGRSETEFME